MDSARSGPAMAFDRLLEEELTDARYLTREEVMGGWRALFPKLAHSLAAPYSIYAETDDTVVQRGYPVLLSNGVKALRQELERHVVDEVAYRLAVGDERSNGRRTALAHRRRYQQRIATILENALVNDYGRGLFDVFLLHHSHDVAEVLSKVPKLVWDKQQDWTLGGTRGLTATDDIRVGLAELFADLLQKGAENALDSLRRLSDVRVMGRMSPLHAVICHDQLLLLETVVPSSLNKISGYLRVRLGVDAGGLEKSCKGAADRLADLIAAQPELGDILALVTELDLDHADPTVFLEPRLLDALEASALADRLDLPQARRKTLRDLGLRLKCFELLAALRRRVLRIEAQGARLHIAGKAEQGIAATTRPFDFATPGIVSTTVRRFGLVYDLTSFTETLGKVRLKGRQEQERALRFMYIFQERLEEIRARRRLTFEKFLGDGAFYSARRGERVLAAACEIQQLYDDLTKRGFPFDQGLRIAINYGSYQLLPMSVIGPGVARFEFFGHGIVELARLTTGKSTRELEDIAEFLVHAGFDPRHVDGFLAPLLDARGGVDSGQHRRFAATLDQRGELVNEGIVLTLPFLAEIEQQIATRTLWVADVGELKWLLFEVDPGEASSLVVGLRALGMARLKGLQPTELIEATVWSKRPPTAQEVVFEPPVITLLRRLSTSGRVDAPEADEAQVPADIVVLSFSEKNGRRRWIFGQYRASDDVLLHAINVPIKAPSLDAAGSVVEWLFENRHELNRVYEGLRRSSSGVSAPLTSLRSRKGYVACFLASPHRTPE